MSFLGHCAVRSGGRTFRLAAVLALAVACVTPRQTYEVDRSQGFPNPYIDVWGVVVELVTGDYPVATIQSDQGLGTIMTEEMATSASEALDCGSGGLLVSLSDHRVQLTFLVRETDAGTTVTINTNFTVLASSLGDSMRRGPCSSTGILEASLHKRIRDKLAAD